MPLTLICLSACILAGETFFGSINNHSSIELNEEHLTSTKINDLALISQMLLKLRR